MMYYLLSHVYIIMRPIALDSGTLIYRRATVVFYYGILYYYFVTEIRFSDY